MAARHPDFFAKAQTFIHKLKALVFEVAILIVFIAWLWNEVKHGIGH